MLLDLIVLSLATWRVAHMVSREDGPFGVFERFREAVGGEGVRCPLCVGVWAAFVAVTIYYAGGMVGWLLLVALAVAGAAAIVQLWLDKESVIDL